MNRATDPVDLATLQDRGLVAGPGPSRQIVKEQDFAIWGLARVPKVAFPTLGK